MKRWLKFGLLGAGWFWLPDFLVHAIRRYSFTAVDVSILSVVIPSFFSLGCFLARRNEPRKAAARIVLWMLLGVWVLGGPIMVASASFSGGGFSSPGGWLEKIGMVLLSIIPVTTFMMATYDGTLFALIGTTLAWGLIAAIKSDRRFTPSRS